MKKVLIITYYWPPSGGSGVQRWLKFAKYLPENKWKPYIYTPENPYLEVIDKDLEKDIHKDTDVWKLPIWEPYKIKDQLFSKKKDTQSSGVIQKEGSLINKFFLWLRGNFFIPDPKKYWINPSVKFLLKKLQDESINTIITTGPPHSMHLIGYELKKKIDIKWIADFRDPWSNLDMLNEFYLSKRSMKKHVNLEKKVLKLADICLTVSESWAQSFKKLGSRRVELITNGFDKDDFSYNEVKREKFIVGHYGLINHLRNPKIFWRVLDDLCSENEIFNKLLEIHFAGNVDKSILNMISDFPSLQQKVKNLGYITHKEVISSYQNSSILLLLLFNSKSGVGNYPGKLFEYFAANRPILAFGPAESDTKNMIITTKSGIYHDYDANYQDLKENVLQLFNQRNMLYQNNELSMFDRRELTKRLVKLLNGLNGDCS